MPITFNVIEPDAPVVVLHQNSVCTGKVLVVFISHSKVGSHIRYKVEVEDGETDEFPEHRIARTKKELLEKL